MNDRSDTEELKRLKRKLEADPYPGWLCDHDFLRPAQLELKLGVAVNDRASPAGWFKAVKKAANRTP